MVLWRLKMRKIFERALIVGLLAAVLTLQGGPVMAQDTYMADAEVDAIIQEFLPAGVSLGDATEDEIEQAIFDAVSSQPVAVLSIVRRAVQLRPEQAPVIAAGAVRVLPDQAASIAYVASENAPYQADAIAEAIIAVVPDQAPTVRNAADYSSRMAIAALALERASESTEQEGSSPSARDDVPASPVK